MTMIVCSSQSVVIHAISYLFHCVQRVLLESQAAVGNTAPVCCERVH